LCDFLPDVRSWLASWLLILSDLLLSNGLESDDY